MNRKLYAILTCSILSLGSFALLAGLLFAAQQAENNAQYPGLTPEAKILEIQHGAYELLMEGKTEEAINEYKKILEIDAKNLPTLQEIGKLYNELNDYPQAVSYFNKALEAKPDDLETKFHLGWVYFKMGRYDDSLKMYNEYLSSNQNNDKAWTDFGVINAVLAENTYFQAADKEKGLQFYGKAIDSYKKAIQLNPSNNVALFELGQLYYGMGRYPEAKIYFEKAAAICQGLNDINCSAAVKKYLEYLGSLSKDALGQPQKIFTQ